MLRTPSDKYRAFAPIDIPDRTWPTREPGDGGVDVALGATGDDDVDAGGDERLGDAPADALASSGDDGRAALQRVEHVVSPFSGGTQARRRPSKDR